MDQTTTGFSKWTKLPRVDENNSYITINQCFVFKSIISKVGDIDPLIFRSTELVH